MPSSAAPRVLALETSSRAASAAVLEGETVRAARRLDESASTAALLTPALADALREAGWRPGDITLVGVSQGPGSFTGLRIGVTTAKTFAYAAGAALIGLNTLEVIAAQAPPAPGPLWAVLDAMRQQLFAARFEPAEPGRWIMTRPTQVIDNAAWLAGLVAGERVTGTGLAPLAAALPAGVEIVDAALWRPRAETVGQLAARRFAAGERHDLWSLVPNYHRPSAAEEKRPAS